MTTHTHSIEPIQATDEALDSIFKHRGGICLSIYLPIEVDPPASDHNPTYLRNLLAEVRSALSDNDMKSKAIDERLAPLEYLVKHPEDLLTEAKTLAFFLDEDSAKSIALPFKVDPVSYVGNRFMIKPLLRLRQEDLNYTALCLNRGSVRVYKGSRTYIEEVSVPDMPKKIEDITAIDDPEKSLQHHTSNTVSANGTPGSAPSAHMHGQGMPSDMERSQVERFLREIGKTLDAYLANDRNPLVIFGVEQNIGLLKSLHEFENRTVLDKHHDPHQWSMSTIREEAWGLLKPECDQATEEKWGLLKAAHNKGETINSVSEATLAACMGQLNLAAISFDREAYGICDLEAGEVKLVEKGAPNCAHDLIDLIASETILHGGEVIVLEQKDLPDSADIVAHKRF